MKKNIIPISEDRYVRERLYLQLALRFLKHEAPYADDSRLAWIERRQDPKGNLFRLHIRHPFRGATTRTCRDLARHRARGNEVRSRAVPCI
jgi:hypothetical protein